MDEYRKPMVFNEILISDALDNYDIADPHRRADEFDDKHTAPLVNQPLYDTSTSTPIHASTTNLSDFPDISDQIFSEYKKKKMLGQPVGSIDNFVDLDTAPDYVNFMKNITKLTIQSENEFSTDNISTLSNMLQNL